jgi:hypothetical protein
MATVHSALTDLLDPLGDCMTAGTFIAVLQAKARRMSISIGTGLFWRVTRRREELPFDASRSTTSTRSFSENC